MLHIVLFSPQIPPNTGNIGRMCTVTGCGLHLVEPIGFSLEEKQLRRAGLDYWQHLGVQLHQSEAAFLEYVQQRGGTLHGITTKADRPYTEIAVDDAREHFVLFGNEVAGLSDRLHQACGERRYRIPMGPAEYCRSLNLASSAAVVIYDILRRTGFPGMA
ncbi:tRNA (cytidine(34)-2'-O)-methyltransferase [Desulfurispira natronophila]|uniref:Putative tRNA (cytidine(34)-2'-O)-methyltransferase n=1 Tax=Desulfurispira natronophila TaxID=682562 RepID=A0A7W7Y652_9BACT|nr:tRNA (cytidine(34)-2'-O)-methyltransferase [Desulfurispira natronophila]MBB5022820.1 tRNA (cytidine/uridine-2'-O-)-methyltransferase [Desulfurispira natronophila]